MRRRPIISRPEHDAVCDQGLGSFGFRHGLISIYRRPFWRLFRRQDFGVCIYCTRRVAP